MKAEKVREMDGVELGRQMQETQEQLFRLRFQMGMGQTEGLKKYRILRKDRARLLTVIQQKQASGETVVIPPVAQPPASGRKAKPAAGRAVVKAKKK